MFKIKNFIFARNLPFMANFIILNRSKFLAGFISQEPEEFLLTFLIVQVCWFQAVWYLSKVVFISLLFLKGYFAEYHILGCISFFSFHTLKMLHHYLLLSIVTDEKPAVILITNPVYNVSFVSRSFQD